MTYAAGQPSDSGSGDRRRRRQPHRSPDGGGRKVRVRLVTSGVTHPDVESANVVAEIRGRERPDEIVLIGGHLDSWDVGTGASDDGVGCIVTWEALRLMKALGLRPRRTVRVVLWTNEENGLRGANAYAERYQAQRGRSTSSRSRPTRACSRRRRSGFQRQRGGAPDDAADRDAAGAARVVRTSRRAAAAPTSARSPRRATCRRWPIWAMPTRLFLIHHTAADTVERIAPEEMSKAAAAIAVVTYAVAEMPETAAEIGIVRGRSRGSP